MKEYTIQFLKELFYSNAQGFRADEIVLDHIRYLLDQGMLKLKVSDLISKEEYFRKIDEVNKDAKTIFDMQGGGIGHIALKSIAKEYLLRKKLIPQRQILCEVGFIGYVPDLVTKDNSILVECGTMEASKIFKYFQEESVNELILIPYPSEQDNALSSYHFTPGPDLAEFLRFREIEMLTNVKQIINRRR